MNSSTLSQSDRNIAINMVNASVADFNTALFHIERSGTGILGVLRLAHQMEASSSARTSILKPLANKIADLIGERLTSIQSEALKLMKDGGDVTSRTLAETLRGIHTDYPELIKIVPVQHKYSVHEKQPWFGAITTPAGLRAARAFKSARRLANATH